MEAVFTALLSRVGLGTARRTRQDLSRIDIADSHLVFKYLHHKVVFVIKDEKLTRNTK